MAAVSEKKNFIVAAVSGFNAAALVLYWGERSESLPYDER